MNATIDKAALAWRSIIGETYFPLDIELKRTGAFTGQVNAYSAGSAELSRLRTDPICYKRSPHQVREAKEEEYIVSIPLMCSVRYIQFGQDVTCAPGGFVIQRSDAPYQFQHEEPSDILALKVKRSELRAFLPNADFYAVRPIDARTGAALLFTEMAKTAQTNLKNVSDLPSGLLGRQLLELLSIALMETGKVEAGLTSVRAAHLHRVCEYVLRNIHDPDLSPEAISDACGISKRYVHYLFQKTDGTVCDFVRNARLNAAREHILNQHSVTISEVAYRFGFCDHSSFSRSFKKKFGMSPREARLQPSRPDAPTASTSRF